MIADREVLAERSRPAIRPLVRLMRPEQWIKNLFVAAPLFFTPAALAADTARSLALGVVAFCLLSSAVYVLNDWVDRASDRTHPTKRHRPLACGAVGPGAAAALLAVLAAAGFAAAFLVSTAFGTIAAAYVALNLLYSFRLKRIAIIDVAAIALGFVLRVEAGAVVIGVAPSAWILIATGLLALFIALAKRRDDLVLTLDGGHRQSLSGYNEAFLDAAVAIVLGALLVTYMIYTTDANVTRRLGTDRLFYTVPFVVCGVLRYLQIMLVEKRSGSPTALVLTDRFLMLTVVGWVAAFGALVHF